MNTGHHEKPAPEDIPNQLRIILESWLDASQAAPIQLCDIHFVTDLGLDSVAILQIILAVEQTFGIVIPAHQLDADILSTAKFVALIESKLHENH